MELQDIGNYKETFENIIQSIQFFEDNIKNTIFEKAFKDKVIEYLYDGEVKCYMKDFMAEI